MLLHGTRDARTVHIVTAHVKKNLLVSGFLLYTRPVQVLHIVGVYVPFL